MSRLSKGLIAALTILLIGHGLASAQQFPDSGSPQPLPPSAARASAVGDPQTFGVFGSAEYLLWWIKRDQVPPLVTMGSNGVIGSPGTRVLLDNLDFVDDFRQGGRFTLGYRFESNPRFTIEASYFFLSDGQAKATFSSPGDPVLAQPYIDVANVVTGVPAATLVSAPGVASGSIAVGARTALSGAEANLTACLICSDRFRLTAIGGFRFLRLEDDLENGEQFKFAGNTVGLQDEFRTTNNFYGGQVGLEAGGRYGMLTIDVRGKIALGQMQQIADINGVTNVLKPDGSTAIFQGGLFALRTNIGRHQRHTVAFIPEVGLDVGLQLTSHGKLYAGYSLLWVSTVARAGEQIDPMINTTQFPILSGNGPLVGRARPAFNFVGADFWAQGLNFGLELKY